LSFSATHRVTQ